jgi:hypothetical protein
MNNICYICGIREASTKDHIFSKGLFSKPRPSNIPRRLPACKECNNGSSKDEELFRVYLASGMAFEKYSGNRIWTDSIRLDLKGERPGLKSLIRSMIKPAKVYSKEGMFLTNTLIFDPPPEPINRVLRKIAKGLYYLDSQLSLPDDVETLIGYDNGKPDKFISPPLDKAFKTAKKVELGEGTIKYWRNIVKDKPEESLTWIQFYEDKVFLILTSRGETSK